MISAETPLWQENSQIFNEDFCLPLYLPLWPYLNSKYMISFWYFRLPRFVLSCFLFRGMVRNSIARVCFFFCSTEHNIIISSVYSVFRGIFFCRKFTTKWQRGAEISSSTISLLFATTGLLRPNFLLDPFSKPNQNISQGREEKRETRKIHELKVFSCTIHLVKHILTNNLPLFLKLRDSVQEMRQEYWRKSAKRWNCGRFKLVLYQT